MSMRLGFGLFAALLTLQTASYAQPPEGPARPPGLRQFDKDGDGALSREEAPPFLKERFDRVDANGDGKIGRAEVAAARRGQAGDTAPGGELPDNVKALRDLAYVPDGHERQKLDLYLPEREEGEKLPLVVWIHGGAWQSGSKEGCPARYLTGEGFAVASVNYRLSGHAPFPAQIHDCKTAIRFLRANADKYGLDPDRIGVWGSSAGGHLVSLLGTSGDVEDLEGHAELEGPDLYRDQSSRVQAVCNYYGPTELLKMGEQSGPSSRIDHDSPNSPESRLVGGPVQARADLARLASPMTHVTNDDPPFLTVHGDSDPVVPVQQGTTFHDALQKAGVESELHVVKGGGHGGFRDPALPGKVTEFFRRTLKSEAPRSTDQEATPGAASSKD
ncbi:MAG TPA: alpha/beta hydrolase fold domain-containing protein [Pirellulaceae bacterium]|jgi:acetyl esterase/lipase|nr:alpha/beta hydrolase fold domain-containing protein [Pirellulaceae bacterium]